MEVLLQQECLNESQLETYKSQLDLVERQLKAGASESDTADLEQLRDNLSQLISLTEDTLLDIKKQRLLLSLQGIEKEPHSDTDPGGKREGGEVEREDQESSGSDKECDDLQGIKCQAPITESWGAVNYHNAVILSQEENSDSGKEDSDEKSVRVRVLFTQPIYNAMKPCPFFLDGKCRFESSVCKFSHGHVVSFSDLQPYREPDYNLACKGGKCISKHTDGLWYPAIISSFDEEFTVHFPSLNVTVETPVENVFPLEDAESSSDSCASSESGEDGEGGEEQVEWVPSSAQRALGEWEKHTTGIGSKLLAKMGYVIGKGLGKSGEGRVEPVEIKIYPAGKSLDVCAEMREKGKLRKAPGEGGQRKRRRRKKRTLTEAASMDEQEKVDIFDFLNAKLRKNDPVTVLTKEPSHPKSSNLNVQLFRVQEDMKSVLKRRQSLMAQLARHKGRDKGMEAHVSEKLSAVEKEVERLKTEEKRVERSLAMKLERKKLRIF